MHLGHEVAMCSRKADVALVFQDAKIVEQACTALTRIATCFSHYPGHLDTLCNSGLVGNAVNLVSVRQVLP